MTKAFIVGHPIKHSRSPLIHGYWLKAYGLDGSYERIDVDPVNFGEFLRSFQSRGFAGGNVTLPHKEAAFAAVDRRTAQAQRVGAVNTLWVEDGLIWGDNTDVTGFMAHLDASLGTGWEQDVDTALVLGAGGAARAVVAGLQDRPIKRIFVANRTLSKAEDLARDLRPGSLAHRTEKWSRFSGSSDAQLKEGSIGPIPKAPSTFGSDALVELETSPWEALGRVIPHAQLIVNTTSLGMAGQPPLTVDLSRAPRRAAVADIVYVPLETPLLAAAAARDLRTVDGLGMLLHQAVPGFRRWFGVTPEVTPGLRALILADIEGAR